MIDLGEYSEWLEGKQLSRNTIKNYCYELRKLPGSFKEQQRYALEYRNRRMLISAWRSYLKYLKKLKRISGDELLELLEVHALPKTRGNSHAKGKAFPKEEWDDIIRNAPNRIAKMGIWVGFHYGLRLSEITYLRVQEVDLEQMLIRITGKGRKDNWFPKYKRERVVPIVTERHVSIFKRWLRERPTDLNHPYLLWLGRTGFQLSPRNFQRWCKQAHPELSPHDLRRSYATDLYYASDKDVKAVQLALGHSNVAVTSDYLRLEETEYLRRIRKALA